MNKSGKQLKRHALALWGWLLFSVSAVTVAQTDVQVENDGLTIRAIISSASNVLSTSIRVVGPDGFVFEDRIEDGALQWIPEGDLADGFYSWEIWTVTVEPGAPMLQIAAPPAATPARVEGKADGDHTSALAGHYHHPGGTLFRRGRQARAYRIRHLRSARRLADTRHRGKPPIISNPGAESF